MLRLSLHPQGLAPRIVNLRAWRAHLLERLQQQIAASGDATLQALHDELAGYPVTASTHGAPPSSGEFAGVAVPFQLATESGVLSFIGPIDNPGVSALRAAIAPKANDYWYYLTAPDGSTKFAKTLAEHNANKAQYLK